MVPVLVVLIVSIAAAAPAQPAARATALVSRVIQPGLPEQISVAVATPPATTAQSISGYGYPDDGSIVKIGSGGAQVAAQAGVSSSAQGGVQALAVSLFAGEITLDTLDVRASVAAGAANASANVSASVITGLTVLGQLVTPGANVSVPLDTWGTLELLSSTEDTAQEPPRSATLSVTALRVKLLTEHGGLAAGSVVEIGVISAAASVAPTAPTPVTKRGQSPTLPTPRPVISPNAPREPGNSIPGAPPEFVRPAPEVAAQLTSGGYVFPAYGPVSFGDTFGAPRTDVHGGWHHGEDIFAPLGTPLLAVADGTIFSVGWNDIGGWRIWLRDGDGNEFYYAHLSAYSPLAVNGLRVKAGDVLGFMGKTGDARASVVHLHFEIHPVSMLALGYDGVVAPYPFLNAWRRAADVSFDAGRVYLPLDGPASARAGSGPPAGAVLLETDDISSESGLTPGALESALSGRAKKARPEEQVG